MEWCDKPEKTQEKIEEKTQVYREKIKRTNILIDKN